MPKKDRTHNLYSWKYYLLVSIVFLIGLILMLFAENQRTDNHWLHFVGEIGAFVAAAIASHFIYDRLLRKDAELLVQDKLKQLLYEYEKESGIISTHKKLPVHHFVNEVQSGQHRLWILQSWIGNFIAVEDAIRTARDKNMSVEILILKSSSSYAIARGNEIGVEDTSYVPTEIITNLKKLCQLSSEANYPKNFQVKLYDSTCIFSIYAVDEIINLGFFWRKKNSTESPHLKLKLRGDSFYFSHNVKAHFDAIWNDATLIDFADPYWKNTI